MEVGLESGRVDLCIHDGEEFQTKYSKVKAIKVTKSLEKQMIAIFFREFAYSS